MNANEQRHDIRPAVDWRSLAERHAQLLTQIQLDLAAMPRTHTVDTISERIRAALRYHRKTIT